MKKKKNQKIFWVILISLFVVYMGLYIANTTGYYESKLNNQVHLTNEAIKKFESDVSKGKDVTIEDYLEKEAKDYSNNISKLGVNLSEKVETLMNKGLKNFFEILGKLFS